MDLLRFITAGSVDDGKSTLIGRLLYDSKAVSLDILDAIERQGKRNDNGDVDLALLTDGLRAEREQGITIDVAYKYFTTGKRKFIIADAPGHIQYTRNMVTGASNANLIIILIDARHGVVEQTIRHSLIASLLSIPHVVVCINKMDLIGFDKEIYNAIKEEYVNVASRLNLNHVEFIPISALNGDNIVTRSKNMNWYDGKNLLDFLEEVHVESDINLKDARFQVQYVIRPQTEEYHDYRGYAGCINSGIYKVGDKVTVLPSGFESEIIRIESANREISEAFAPMPVVLHLKDEIDISRGDTIVLSDNKPEVSQDITANLCWMDSADLKEGSMLLLQQHSFTTKAIVKEILYKINVNTLDEVPAEGKAQLNDIIKVKLRTASPVSFDNYAINRNNGGFILINENTCNTVAAGMFLNRPLS